MSLSPFSVWPPFSEQLQRLGCEAGCRCPAWRLGDALAACGRHAARCEIALCGVGISDHVLCAIGSAGLHAVPGLQVHGAAAGRAGGQVHPLTQTVRIRLWQPLRRASHSIQHVSSRGSNSSAGCLVNIRVLLLQLSDVQWVSHPTLLSHQCRPTPPHNLLSAGAVLHGAYRAVHAEGAMLNSPCMPLY